MDNPEKADRELLMESYGYRHKGMFGILRLYCRQGYSLLLNYMAKRALLPSLRVAFQRARGVKIGEHVYLGFNVDIDNVHPDLVTIEDYVGIGMNTMIFAHSNATVCVEIKEHYYRSFTAPTTIKRDAAVFPGCIILAGVTIGEVSVVGAGTVVTKDVEPYTVVAGNPARVIRRLERRTDASGRPGSSSKSISDVEPRETERKTEK